jgi:archaemetzincin
MKWLLFTITIFSAFPIIILMEFKVPTSEERLNAIGSTDKLADILQRAFEPGKDFDVIPTPKTGDWLAVHYEPGQSFKDFVKTKTNKPDKKRNRIYLQPIGESAKGGLQLIETLKEYASIYFAMPVDVLASLSLKDKDITTRINPFTKNRQILTTDVLTVLKENLPDDAFCVPAITMEDLYPEPSWNFVFGQASLRERVGVYSFARYNPAFYGDSNQTDNKDYEKILLKRSCRVLAHETAHMFGLLHCIYFRCVLNGSNHLKESDSRPLHLCPVCLRKLQHSAGFNVVNRYVQLFHFYQRNGFNNESQWIARRLEWILGRETAKKLLEQKKEQ